MPESDKPPLAKAMIVTQFIAELIGPTLIGYYLDRRYGWSPYGTLIGAALGFSIGMGHLIRFALKEAAEDERGRRR